MEITNPIGKFYTLKSVIELKIPLLCHSLFLEIFDFDYPFQDIEFANGICSFHCIFYIVFHSRKLFYAPCGVDSEMADLSLQTNTIDTGIKTLNS